MVFTREDAEALVDAAGGPGDPERRRVVVGRDFPFLKKGTLTLSVVDIVVSEQQAVLCQPNLRSPTWTPLVGLVILLAW